MRILMLGTGPFAVATFTALLDSAHTVPALITRPTPAAKGREKTSLNPMRDLAESRGLPVFAPESVNSEEGTALLKELAPDLLMVCDYGQILSKELLGLVPYGGINLHASLLPKYRGAAPIHWAILQGETETGLSVIHMTPRLDGGPLLAVRKLPIDPQESMAELEQRLAVLGVEAVLEAIEKLADWDRISPIGSVQDASQATKAPRLKKQDGQVDWNRSATQIANQVRALKPWPTTYTHWLRAGTEPLRLILDRVAVANDFAEEVSIRSQAAVPGQVLLADGKQLLVATGSGVLALQSIQPAGKKCLTIAEFLRGYPLLPSDRLGNLPNASFLG